VGGGSNPISPTSIGVVREDRGTQKRSVRSSSSLFVCAMMLGIDVEQLMMMIMPGEIIAGTE
jgi:hypothetical protein